MSPALAGGFFTTEPPEKPKAGPFGPSGSMLLSGEHETAWWPEVPAILHKERKKIAVQIMISARPIQQSYG